MNWDCDWTPPKSQMLSWIIFHSVSDYTKIQDSEEGAQLTLLINRITLIIEKQGEGKKNVGGLYTGSRDFWTKIKIEFLPFLKNFDNCYNTTSDYDYLYQYILSGYKYISIVGSNYEYFSPNDDKTNLWWDPSDGSDSPNGGNQFAFLLVELEEESVEELDGGAIGLTLTFKTKFKTGNLI